MSFIIDPIVDFITDVVDLVVDVVSAVVDLVVDAVDAVFDFVGGLLGFDQDDPQIIEQFQVLNQPLFDDPDKSQLSEVIIDAIRNNEDIIGNVLYASVFQSGKKNVRHFTEFIENDDYFEDFPTVKASVMVIDYDEIDDVLTNIYSTPVTIDTARLGTLFVPHWIKYWLQENKSYNSSNGTFIHNSTTYTVNVYNSIYNSGNNDYTLRLGDPLANFTGFNVPSKPTGLHYVVTFHKDNDPTRSLVWTYEVGAGTYTDLDDPDEEFGQSGGTTLNMLPAIPLRINNTNFNATTTTKSTQITTLAKKVGVDAPQLISSIMEDVASAGIADYNTKVDHVFLNFGVRLWETSQIGLNYLFRFVSTLYPGQGVTKGIYDAAADDKPYNNIHVEGTDYKYVFSFAYITFTHYSLATVNSDSNSTIFSVYYSDLTKFTSGQTGNSDLTATYYVSSGYPTYAVGYLCTTTAHVNAFLAETLPQESSYAAEAANWMQPTQRITFTGTLINSDDSTNNDGVLKPSLLYELVPDGNVTQITSNTTYQILAGTSPIKIEISGGGGAGGGAKAGSGSGSTGGSGGTTYARVYNASGTLLNTYSAGGGAGGAADQGGSATGQTGESFGGPGSNGVPSGAHSSFSGSGGAGGNDGEGSNASGYSAGGGGGGDEAAWYDFDTDRYGIKGSRGAYSTVNHTVANYTDYIVITIGSGGQGGGSNRGGHGSAGRCVLTPTAPVNTLRLVNKAAEQTTVNQEMIYYQVVANGLNAYTLKGPKMMLRVVDAQTDKFKMVAFNLANKTDLMIPMSYDMVKDLPNAHVSSLFVAAAHISLYVAHYEVIETPTWVKVLKIIQVVLFIMGVLGFNKLALAITYIITEVLKRYIMKELLTWIAKEYGIEAAIIVALFIGYKYGNLADLDLSAFEDILTLLTETADILNQVVSIYAHEELEDLKEEERKEKILTEKQMNPLYEAEQALFMDNEGNSLDLVNSSIRGQISPMSPVEYIGYYENYNEIAIGSYDYDHRINRVFDPEIILT